MGKKNIDPKAVISLSVTIAKAAYDVYQHIKNSKGADNKSKQKA